MEIFHDYIIYLFSQEIFYPLVVRKQLIQGGFLIILSSQLYTFPSSTYQLAIPSSERSIRTIVVSDFIILWLILNVHTYQNSSINTLFNTKVTFSTPILFIITLLIIRIQVSSIISAGTFKSQSNFAIYTLVQNMLRDLEYMNFSHESRGNVFQCMAAPIHSFPPPKRIRKRGISVTPTFLYMKLLVPSHQRCTEC